MFSGFGVCFFIGTQTLVQRLIPSFDLVVIPYTCDFMVFTAGTRSCRDHTMGILGVCTTGRNVFGPFKQKTANIKKIRRGKYIFQNRIKNKNCQWLHTFFAAVTHTPVHQTNNTRDSQNE
jgi:hypothetical protein